MYIIEYMDFGFFLKYFNDNEGFRVRDEIILNSDAVEVIEKDYLKKIF